MLISLLRIRLRPYRTLLAGVLVLQVVQVMSSLYLPNLNADIIDIGVAQGIERAQRDVAEIADGRRTDVDGSGHAAIIRIGSTNARSSPEVRLRL